MSGRMRKRENGGNKFHPAEPGRGNILKGFHPPQKDSSKRQKKKHKLNQYKEDQ